MPRFAEQLEDERLRRLAEKLKDRLSDEEFTKELREKTKPRFYDDKLPYILRPLG